MVQMETEKEGCERRKVMVAIDENKSSYHALIWVLENLQEIISTTSSDPNPNPLVVFATQPFTSHVLSDGSVGVASLYCPLLPSYVFLIFFFLSLLQVDLGLQKHRFNAFI